MKHITLIILCLLFATCKKKDSPAEPSPEEPVVQSLWEARSAPFTDIVPQQNITGCDSLKVVASLTEPYNFTDPCVNPTNTAQCCFLRHSNSEPASAGSDLILFDLNTNKIKVLAREVFFRPDISKKGWILFTAGKDFTQIFKIKLNGDSLQTLVTANSPQEAKWSADGSQFSFYCSVCDIIKIADENGVIKKTLKEKFTAWEWKNEQELFVMKASLGTPSFQLCLYDLNTDAIKQLHYSTGTSKQTLHFDQSTKRLYLTGGSLFQLDEAGNVLTSLKSFEWHDRNRCPNSTGDWLLSERVLSEKLQNETCKISERHLLSVMPRSGGVERRLVIPEN